MIITFVKRKSLKCVCIRRLAQLAELPRSKFDPEIFPHSAYVKIFATKVPYLTFCIKILQMEREGGNGERMRKCRESISLYFLLLSPFPLHFLAATTICATLCIRNICICDNTPNSKLLYRFETY